MHPISQRTMNSTRPMAVIACLSGFLLATTVAGSTQFATATTADWGIGDATVEAGLQPSGHSTAEPQAQSTSSGPASAQSGSSGSQEGPAASSQNRDQASQKENGTYALPRGKKLMLKNGTFQMVRSYERNGDRVRYYSVERSQWEEIPAALVDWDATAKAEASEKSENEAFAKKVHTQEEAQRMDTIMDVDASLQVAPGVFLPPGEGMFVIDGKHVSQLEQAGAEVRTDKKNFLTQVLVPIPVVPGKRNIDIPGPRAKLRVSSTNVEFYLREAPPDPDRNSPIEKSSRPGESGPEVELVRATVKGGKRQLESIKTMFGEQVQEQRKTLSMQRWEIAPTVYRFTLGEPLPPGEYALAEILSDGMNLFVWDFGVDNDDVPRASPKK